MPGTTPVHLPHLDLIGGGVDDLNTLLTGPVVTITGTRGATAYGEHLAASLAVDLARSGVTLLVGDGFGIEFRAATAHAAQHGRVILVRAAGIDKGPRDEPEHLNDQIVDAGGMIAALAPAGQVASKEHAQRRCRTLAMVTGAVVVVEATVKSLPMMLAETAADRGAPVFAVPGPVTSELSQGPHRLIATGRAHLITGVPDMGDLHNLTGRPVSVG